MWKSSSAYLRLVVPANLIGKGIQFAMAKDMYDIAHDKKLEKITTKFMRPQKDLMDIYTNLGFKMAFEGGGTVIDTDQLREVDPSLFNVKAKDVLPDLIARYTYQGDFGYVKLAGMLRNLEYELVSVLHEKAENRNEFGWAVNLTSNIYTFNKKGVFLLQGVFGEGYAGYNNDGGVELAPGADYRIETPFQYGFSAFYDHQLTDRFLVSIGYSETNQDNSEGQPGTAFHKSKYSVTQFTYTILKDVFNVGINYQYGKRYNKDGASADDQRILFTAVYFFSFKH